MSASSDTTTTRTRRALLTAALGAGAATVATAVARPLPASADNGGNLVLGTYPTGSNDGSGTNKASSMTGLWASNGHALRVLAAEPDSHAVWAETTSATGFSNGVSGYSAAAAGNGLYGESTDTAGYSGGVSGYAASTKGVGVWGQGGGNATGVIGITGSADPFGSGSGAPALTGVIGTSTLATEAVRGVVGDVSSSSTASRGVFGRATAGHGVSGSATTGVALYGATTSPLTGYALRTSGRVKFDKASGSTTISGGTKSRLVTPGVDVSSSSVVIATLNGSAGGTITVHRVAIDATNNQFRIYLTGTATKSVKVAWMIIG